MGWNIRQLNLEKTLRIIVIFESLYWALQLVFSLFAYYQFKFNLKKTKEGGLTAVNSLGKESDNHSDDQNELILAQWTLYTGFILCFIQLFLHHGVSKKNRCLIFTWIVISSILGFTRIIIIQLYSTSFLQKLSVWLWIPRLFFIYLAADFMLQITNERRGAEEVAAPHFRPQSLDPREFREGLNYPSYPRSLQFAERISALNKLEHSHPRRWEPTYDAIDEDGRIVVVVDDPVYESL